MNILGKCRRHLAAVTPVKFLSGSNAIIYTFESDDFFLEQKVKDQ